MRKVTEIISIIFAVLCGICALVLFICAGVVLASVNDSELINDLATTWQTSEAATQQAVQLIGIYLLVMAIFATVSLALGIVIAVLCSKGIGEHVLVVLGVVSIVFQFSIIIGILAIITGAHEIKEDHEHKELAAE